MIRYYCLYNILSRRSLRNYILKPRVIDSLFKRIRGGYLPSIEYKDEWQICFWDEGELSELLRQMI